MEDERAQSGRSQKPPKRLNQVSDEGKAEKIMRFRVLSAALFAVLAIGVVVAASPAMAEFRCVPVVEGLWELQKNVNECEVPLPVGSTLSPWELVTFLLASWLEGGAEVSESMLVTSSGELTLENKNEMIINKPAGVLCSGILDGFVGPNSADDITELLNLDGEAISLTALGGTVALECELVLECENGSLAWAVNLPWLTELELWEIETPLLSGFVDLILPHTGGGNIGWYVECLLGLLKQFEECLTPEVVAEQFNIATGVEVIFTEEFTLLMGAKFALCDGNNEETGVVKTEGNGKGITVNSLTPVLSVSSEG